MKRQGKMLIAVMGAVCLLTQPALAAGTTGMQGSANLVREEWVSVGEGENAMMWMQDSPEAVPKSGSESTIDSTTGQEATSTGDQSTPPAQEAASTGDQSTSPAQEAASAGDQSTPPAQEAAGEDSQAPGGEQPQTSTVIMAGQSEEPQNQGPAFKAAQEEAARQAAEEAAARQAAEEAAAQQAAAEEAARLAAEEAARLAAEEAARQAAAQQAGGRVVDPSRPMVALTYDDGPQPSVGNRIMDCLAQYGGKATFFLVGERVGSYASEVQRMVAEGHEVANHSMNHKYLQKQGAAEIQAQVSRCNTAIEAACGVRPRLMRLPGGNYNSTVLANTHMPMIQWNIDTKDWKTKNAQQTINVVLSQVKDGDIVLMHELYGATGDASMQIIPELTRRGFQLVTVSEMAAAKGRTLEPGKLYSAFH